MRGRGPRSTLLAVMALAAPVRADVLPTMTARPLIDGIVRQGRIVPVEVTISNTEVPIPRAQVRLAPAMGRLAAVRDLDLPSFTRKTVTLYVDVNAYQSEFKVDLIAPVALASVDVTGNAVEEPRVVAAMVGDATWGLRAFSRDTARPLTLANLPPSTVPDRWYGWDVADVVLWPENSGAPASVEQARALQTWVRMGGTLVLSVSSDGKAYDAVRDLLPATVAVDAPVARDLLQVALGLEADAGALQEGPAAVPVARLVPRPGGRVRKALAVEDGLRPLIVEADEGMGRVILLAFDPSIAAVGSHGLPDLWVDLLPIPEVPEGAPGRLDRWDRVLRAAESFVEDIPPLKPVSARFLLLFMGAYVIVVGPLDYFVLKKLKRMTLTWVTYPAAIVVFSALAYGFASSMKGSEMVVTSVQVVDAVQGQPSGRRTALTGIFAVERSVYPVRLPETAGALSWDPSGQGVGGGGILMGGNQVVRRDGAEGVELSLPINIFTMERVMSREVWKPTAAAPMPLEVTVGDRWHGAAGWFDIAVKNASGQELHEVSVVGPEGMYTILGEIAPGESARVSTAGKTPMRASDTINAGLGAGWAIQRDPLSGRLIGVAGRAAGAFGLGVTTSGTHAFALSGRGLGFLDLTARLDRGAFVVLGHTFGEEPSPVSVRDGAHRGQTLQIWRVVVAPPGAVEAEIPS